MPRLALVGDHDPAVVAHRAIPLALASASAATGVAVSWQWVGTDTIRAAADLAGCDAVWCIPASPYRRMDGALAAIRHARERGLPFLGTCGGFQHAVIEFARHVAGLPQADHAETAAPPSAGDAAASPGTSQSLIDKSGPAPELVVTPLVCSLVEQSGEIRFTPGSRLHAVFAGQPTVEGYHCSYGVNAAYRARLEAAGLRFTGFDAAGDIRACELPSHRFFVGTLFQPERSALAGRRHPLIEAFVRAMA